MHRRRKIELNKIYNGNALDVLKTLPCKIVDCCVTSPPYFGLRDYGVDGQLGLEETPEEYIKNLVSVFSEIKRVIKDNGTLWVNIADSYSGSNKGRGTKNYSGKQASSKGSIMSNAKTYNGLKPKDLIGIPWLLAFALREDGWYLRQDIIWHKPNPMPESVRDRCTKAHEYIFLLSKSKKYYYDHEAIKEDAITKPKARNKNKEGYQADYLRRERFSEGERVYGSDGKRNKRDVWTVSTKPYKEAHFATFPSDLIEPCILAGSPKGGIVLDPFFGSGTVGEVSIKNERNYIGIDLNMDYCKLAEKRIEACISA